MTNYMKKLCERSERIRSGIIDRRADNMLKVSTDGRKAALDLTLVGEKQAYDKTSKIRSCVKNVMQIYAQYSGSTQLVFCDYSTPRGDDFSVYKELRRRLMEEGVLECEIAFIHSFGTESRKVELFRRFNAGEVRILIGSTFKLGIGANVQVKLKAIHHLDVPWRPADMVQREGRILRRGNENKNVQIFHYSTQGSFDAYAWQILETKQRFISQFLSGSAYQRSISDLEDNVLTYAEVKALALSEPLMKQIAEKENRVKGLRIVVAKEEESLYSLAEEEKECNKKCAAFSRRYLASIATYRILSKYGREDRRLAMQELAGVLTQDFISGREDAGTQNVLCFTLALPQKQSRKKPFVILRNAGEEYTVEMGESAAGNARRVMNFINAFPESIKKTEKAKTELQARLAEIRRILDHPDDTNSRRLRTEEAELAKLKERVCPNATM